MVDDKTRELITRFQQNEINEHHIYKHLAKGQKGRNRKILQRISNDELRHYNSWKKYTRKDISPDSFTLFKYKLMSKLFGMTFAVKTMEKGEEHAQNVYNKVLRKYPETRNILRDENAHEQNLVDILRDSRLSYIGSIVLGLNDAIVEMTGALAGLSFALQNTTLVALAGLITGIAASMSMASSEYLSKKTEDAKAPFKASLYTGFAYFIAVILLVLPFFVFADYVTALSSTIIIVVIIIAFFNYFTSVVKDVPFKNRFLQMLAISLGVAVISFAIGIALRTYLGISV